MEKRLILLAILFFYGVCLFGQFGAYKKGLVVLNNGDTLRGSVKDDVQEVNCKKVFFKDLNGSKKVYYACDIRSFQREKDHYIKGIVDSVNNDAIQGLLKVISDGKCKLLKYKSLSLMSGSGTDSGFSPKIYYYVLTPDGLLIWVFNRNYQQLIDKYYSDRKVKGEKYRFGNIESDFHELNSM
jgi:hypothetical protein